MLYELLKHLHIATVNLTFALFVVRGYWMIIDSPMLVRHWVRVVPHVNDTVLLIAAIALTVLGHWHPLTDGWLTAKLIALLLYIALGSLALRPGRPKWVRVTAWLLALLVFAYIILVAVMKDPWIF